MRTAQRSKRFREWFDGLADAKIRSAIAQRIERLEKGLPGDVEPVGNGVYELRIHLGSGWRIYYIEVGGSIILLLGGGTKKPQQTDINRARKTVQELEKRRELGAKAAPSSPAKPVLRKKIVALLKSKKSPHSSFRNFTMSNEHNLTLADLEELELDEFDASEYLTSDEAIAAYLTEALECGNAGLVAQALGKAARARGMAEIAQKTGLAREGLYKALRANSQPRLDTVSKVLSAFNIRLVAEVIPKEQRVLMPLVTAGSPIAKKSTAQRLAPQPPLLAAEEKGKTAQSKIAATKKKAAPAKQTGTATK